jgi:hypothetical protein
MEAYVKSSAFSVDWTNVAGEVGETRICSTISTFPYCYNPLLLSIVITLSCMLIDEEVLEPYTK